MRTSAVCTLKMNLPAACGSLRFCDLVGFRPQSREWHACGMLQTTNRREVSMCYSAQIQADYRKYVRMFGAHMSIEEFGRLFFERAEGNKAKIPKRHGGRLL